MTRLKLTIAALLLSSPALAAAPPALYTAQQAADGAGAYSQNCAMCHGADLTGAAGPALVGQAFAGAGNGLTVGGVFTQVAEQMPAGQPGSLSKTQYEDIMAYILKSNGYPAGTTALVYKDALASKLPLVSTVK